MRCSRYPHAGSFRLVLALSVLLAAAAGAVERYHSYTGERIADTAPPSLPFCSVEVEPCDPEEGRRLDSSCNNLRHPPLGAALTPYRRMLPPAFAAGWSHRVSLSGAPLPGARALRTALVSDGRAHSRRYSHLVTHLLVMLTGEVTSLHDTVNYVVLTTTCCAGGAEVGARDPRCQPIPVPEDDPVLRHSDVRCLNLTRAITYQRLGCVSGNVPPERINTATPMIDLSVLYGNTERGARAGREGEGGRLREERGGEGRLFPPSGSPACLFNRPPLETRCHRTPNPGINSVIGMNLMVLWWYRNHNRVARRLQRLNPCWDDERLYRAARDLNVACLQHTFYYELVPLILGYKYAIENGIIYENGGHVDDYDDQLRPTLSIEYVIGTRWFHTMQEGFINLYDKDGELYGRRPVVDDTLRSGILDLNRTIEGLTQGSFRQPTADIDFLVDPDIGNRILGRLQRVSDVVASDIMKGRDVGLPSYNTYRRLCGMQSATHWKHFLDTIDKDKVEIMSLMYSSPEDVDVMSGMLVERTAEGGGMVGPTLACIMADQLRRWRRADRFWYENRAHPGSFSPEQLQEIRKFTTSRLLCDNADEVDSIQPRAYLIPGKRNKMVSCEKIESPQLSAWLDPSCSVDEDS